MKLSDIGDQTRSFCYITDTVAAILRIATRKNINGEVFNIGNPHEVTIFELAEQIKAIANSRSKIRFHPRPADHPQRRCPDITKAQKLLVPRRHTRRRLAGDRSLVQTVQARDGSHTNLKSIAIAIIRFLQDDSLREDCGRSSRERAIAEFGWELRIRCVKEFYSRFLA